MAAQMLYKISEVNPQHVAPSLEEIIPWLSILDSVDAEQDTIYRLLETIRVVSKSHPDQAKWGFSRQNHISIMEMWPSGHV